MRIDNNNFYFNTIYTGPIRQNVEENAKYKALK